MLDKPDIIDTYRGFGIKLRWIQLDQKYDGHWCAYLTEVPEEYEDMVHMEADDPYLEGFEPHGGWTYFGGLGWDYVHDGDREKHWTEATVMADVKRTIDMFLYHVSRDMYIYHGWKWDLHLFSDSGNASLLEAPGAFSVLSTRRQFKPLLEDAMYVPDGWFDLPGLYWHCEVSLEEMQADIRQLVDEVEKKQREGNN